MFTIIEADIPVYAPGQEAPVHARLTIDQRREHVSLQFDHPMAEKLLMMLRFNNLLGLYITLGRIDDPPIGLTTSEIELADKLTDAGMTQEQAFEWVRDIVTKAIVGNRE